MDLGKLTRAPSVAVAMTPFPHSVSLDDSLDVAQEVMSSHGIRHVPVQENHRLVGILAQRDVSVLLGSGRAPEEREAMRVRDVCITGAYIVELHEPLAKVALEMARRHIGSALVVKEGRLAGIFTATDACRLLGEILGNRFSKGGPRDAA